MLEQSQLIPVGRVTHTHGLNGELTVQIDNPVFWETEHCPYLVCEVDGIFVPFFISQCRQQNHTTALLTFDDVPTEEKARFFVGRNLWFDRRCFSPEEAREYDSVNPEEELPLVGYSVIDSQAGPLGKILRVDSQTANLLFIIDHNGEELMVPAADDLILDIDDDEKTVRMQLPDGLLDLDAAETVD